jgi:hypothetical protein
MRVNVPLTFLLGAAVGYVAGSAAGRRRYEQIRSAADTFVHDQGVRDTASKVATTAASAGAVTVSKARDVAGSVKDAVKDKVEERRDNAADEDSDEDEDTPAAL